MNSLLAEAFDKAQNLPVHLQDELAQQLLEDIESELQWQQTLSQPPSSVLENLARQALQDSLEGKTHEMGFDEL
ncbi:MAG: hypothetical protein ACO31I_15760 [Prochlorotrichaceae cyanobacterium]|jgi:hypothetical protein